MAITPTLYNVCSAISDCGSYGAQVTCMVRLSQGATGCVEIQIYDKDLQRADLSKFGVIQILVTDVGNNVVAIFSQPELIGNYFDAPLEIQTDGVLKGCFTAEMTSNAMTGRLMAEIKMIEDAPTGASPDVVIIKCIEIGSIKESQFSLGFTSDGVTIGGGSGSGTLLGVTSGTSGSSGYNGTSGTSGFGTDGTSGSSGTSGSGTSGSDGSSGTSGENGTSGTSGINGTSGTSGVGTDGTSGTSGDGTSGTSGISGSSGTSGSGVDGAVTLRWILENTSGAIPSGSSYFSACCNSGLLNTGSFKFAYNSSTISSEGFWVTITGAIANGLTPYLQIVQVSDRNVIGLYEITGVTYSGAVGSGQYNVTANGIPAIYGNGIWSVGEEYAVSFSLSGTTGSSGTSGENGTSGSSGTSGTGVSGTSGTSGVAGSSGTSGTSGLSGTSGNSGTSGSSGTTGTSGSSGTSGIAGSSGTSGIAGSSGTSGSTGTSGTSGIGSSGTSGTSGVGSSGTSGSTGTSGTSFASPYTGNLNVTSGQAWVSADANGNTTANTTVDWNTGNVQTFTLNAATTTFTFSNGQAGATYILIIRQNAAGSQTIVWPGTVTWTSTPTMTATANRYDIYTFIFDGSKYFGSYVQNYV